MGDDFRRIFKEESHSITNAFRASTAFIDKVCRLSLLQAFLLHDACEENKGHDHYHDSYKSRVERQIIVIRISGFKKIHFKCVALLLKIRGDMKVLDDQSN